MRDPAPPFRRTKSSGSTSIRAPDSCWPRSTARSRSTTSTRSAASSGSTPRASSASCSSKVSYRSKAATGPSPSAQCPEAKKAKQNLYRQARQARRVLGGIQTQTLCLACLACLAVDLKTLKNVPGEVFVLEDAIELVADIGGVDADGLTREIRSGEGDVFEDLLENGVQAAGADVLRPRVHVLSDAGQLLDAARVEDQLDSFRAEQRGVLPSERVARLRQDAHQVRLRERLQLDADGKATLQLRQQIAHLRPADDASGNEQHVVGLHRPVFRVHRAPFDDGEQIALDAAARDVGPVRLPRGQRHLVDLVDEHDPVRLHPLQRIAHEAVLVDEL